MQLLFKVKLEGLGRINQVKYMNKSEKGDQTEKATCVKGSDLGSSVKQQMHENGGKFLSNDVLEVARAMLVKARRLCLRI